MAHPLLGQEYKTTSDDATADSVVPIRQNRGHVLFEAYTPDDTIVQEIEIETFKSKVEEGKLRHA